MTSSEIRHDQAGEEPECELSSEQIRELRRRIKDAEDPVRYVIYSELLQGKCSRLFFNA